MTKSKTITSGRSSMALATASLLSTASPQICHPVPIVLNTLSGTAEVEREASKYGIRKVVDKGKPGALISAVEELLSAA